MTSNISELGEIPRLIMLIAVRLSGSGVVRSIWTPGLIENGKVGGPERNIEVPTRVALSVHKMVIYVLGGDFG